jgi:anti-sigma regulatory factor (Ser/Thr protein kinase)
MELHGSNKLEAEERGLKLDTTDRAVLQVYADERFLSVVTGFAESMAIALGFERPEALAITLAAEEIFSHLCRVVLPGGVLVEMCCSGGNYYVRVDFSFPADDFDMRAFNITSTVSSGDEVDFEQMGLFLASRSVDRFSMAREDGQGLKLSLIKEKPYPRVEPGAVQAVIAMDTFSLKVPNAEELKFFTELAGASYGDLGPSDIFSYPGKLVDMVEEGDYQAILAVGPAGEVGAGTFWRWISAGAVEWFGPYVFSQALAESMSAGLLERCIASIARTSAVVLINRFPTPQFPRESFEYLGTVRTCSRDGACIHREAWARLLREDPGSVAWSHPQVREYLLGEYNRLVLPRDVRVVKSLGEKSSRHSAILTACDRVQGSVAMGPVWFGEDFPRNLGQHVEFLQGETPNIFFSLDVGQSWQADFVPGLLHNGFTPCCILPYAGTGDIVIFQLEHGHDRGVVS